MEWANRSKMDPPKDVRTIMAQFSDTPIAGKALVMCKEFARAFKALGQDFLHTQALRSAAVPKCRFQHGPNQLSA